LAKSGATPGTSEIVRTFIDGFLSEDQPGTVVADRLFFVVDDGIDGPTLWSTTGTAPTTAPVASDRGWRTPQSAVPDDGRQSGLLHRQRHVPGTRAWRTDGTAAGTFIVLEAVDEPDPDTPLTAIGTRLFFVSTGEDEGVLKSALWTSDGTPAGTTPLLFDSINELTAVGARSFFW
jgi:hypothetical protein